MLKRILSIWLMLCVMLVSLSACGKVTATEIGNPQKERFIEGEFACTAWDMTIYNGKLYVGSGDYDQNKGPTDIWRYDLITKVWEKSGTVNGEQVSRFNVIGGRLVAPGIDPRGVDWEHTDQAFNGDYYVLEGDEWVVKDNLLGAIHNFDMVENDGKIFAGLGVKEGASAVVCSNDGGETFNAVDFYKGGNLIDTSGSAFIRVYELFVKDGQTFALLRYGAQKGRYELFRYDGGIFNYFADWTDKFYGTQLTYDLFSGKAVYNGKAYFTYGNLFVTEDMQTINKVDLKENAMTVDIIVVGDNLYLLCLEKEEEGHRISVWKNNAMTKSGFSEIFYFYYEIPVLSFAYGGQSFYFGAGSRTMAHQKNGNVLRVDYKV